MNSKLLKALSVLTLISFYACTITEPVSTAIPKNNQDYEVDYLFEHNGIKVYRFYDRDNYVYFTDKKGEEVTSIANDSTEMRVTTLISK